MSKMPYESNTGAIYRYGEFFPREFSPFAYNESMLQDSFPLKKEQAIAKNYPWRDPEAREYETTLIVNDLPDHIKDVQDSITKELIKCSSCGRAYRIISAELDFLRRIGIPLPHMCSNCRVRERYTFLNAPRFTTQTCACVGTKDKNGIYRNTSTHPHGTMECSNQFETAYAPDCGEIVYCEQCYQAEVA